VRGVRHGLKVINTTQDRGGTKRCRKMELILEPHANPNDLKASSFKVRNN
jgi:hypothetical protein